MANGRRVGAVLFAACVDTDLRIAPEEAESNRHLLGRDDIPMLAELRAKYGEIDPSMLKGLRDASGGGGYSESCARLLETAKCSDLEVVAILSKRHTECAALATCTHLSDPDMAVMVVHDFTEANLPIPPVIRGNVKINRETPDQMKIIFNSDLMDLHGLVAHAVTVGETRWLPKKYNPILAARLLGMSDEDVERRASGVVLTSKGLIPFDET